MTTGPARRPDESTKDDAAPVDPAWFLRSGCRWQDDIWDLKPSSTLEEAGTVKLYWDFALPSGQRFVDQRYASLLESSKLLIALIRTRSLSTGLSQRASTVKGYFI